MRIIKKIPYQKVKTVITNYNFTKEEIEVIKLSNQNRLIVANKPD